MMHRIKEGTVLYLKKRNFSLFVPATWVSNIISIVQGKTTHTAIVFKDINKLKVREMEAKGVVVTSLLEYLRRNYSRIHSFTNLTIPSESKLSIFRKECSNLNIKYDKANLVIRQPLHFLFGTRWKTDTVNSRICSEDTARCVNKLEFTFNNPENVSPQEMFIFYKKRRRITKWKY